ncbi:unnamed protein product [Peronospora farinosa]|uniref:Protein kinase domain-containing protein n=1 Tax=Peronospora farinosa TaxID=134698 RepID=A0AAV0TD45_9STRA|nr:unnamed protein product [Peronospora farinosa]CAI5718829.1 unnamed protein product [Peronospora farinosa]
MEWSSEIQTLQLQGVKTHVEFYPSSLWMGKRLATLEFIGLDLSNTTLPKLPSSLTQLQITNCVLYNLPVTWLLSLPQLESIVLMDNYLTDATQTLTELSNQQFTLLSGRVVSNMVIGPTVEEAQIAACTEEKGGSVQRLGQWPVCVTPDDAVIARKLLIFTHLRSSGSSLENSSSFGSSSHDHDTSALVMLSLGLPFIFCLYKMGLFIYFMRTNKRYSSEGGGTSRVGRVHTLKNAATATTRDTDAGRPTVNVLSTSPPPSPSPCGYQKRDKQPFESSNAEVWVDKELQSWQLDFQRLKMLKCLNLLPTEKRTTLRKQSITSAMNPREIWLASLADESMAAASPGEGAPTKLVVAKYLAPKFGQGRRSSASGNTKDKLKRELKRQAIFSHPQVVTFIGVAWSRETHLIAVTEYMAQGDLRRWLHRTASTHSGKWSIVKVQMLLDVSRALLYLHTMHTRLVHGNCNSRNVLLDQSLRAKLSDFGVDGSDSLTEQELMSYSAVGSGRWISPEALLGCETSASYPDASDVYSFGILIAELDSHELPFSDLMQANRAAVPETNILQLISMGALSPTLSPTCPPSIVKLVDACTSYKPKNRPSSSQVQQHLRRILEDFREFESKTTATISVGAQHSHPPSNLV